MPSNNTIPRFVDWWNSTTHVLELAHFLRYHYTPRARCGVLPQFVHWEAEGRPREPAIRPHRRRGAARCGKRSGRTRGCDRSSHEPARAITHIPALNVDRVSLQHDRVLVIIPSGLLVTDDAQKRAPLGGAHDPRGCGQAVAIDHAAEALGFDKTKALGERSFPHALPFRRVDMVVEASLRVIRAPAVQRQYQQRAGGEPRGQPIERVDEAALGKMRQERAAKDQVERARQGTREVRRRLDRTGGEGLGGKAFTAFVEVGNEQIGVGEERAQVPRHPAGAARKIEHAGDVRLARGDHGACDDFDRRPADLQIGIAVIAPQHRIVVGDLPRDARGLIAAPAPDDLIENAQHRAIIAASVSPATPARACCKQCMELICRVWVNEAYVSFLERLDEMVVPATSHLSCAQTALRLRLRIFTAPLPNRKSARAYGCRLDSQSSTQGFELWPPREHQRRLESIPL
jgi:hypothetical protein